MTQTLKLASLLLGALALSLTLATAEGKCGNATKETDTKPAPAKGKCGQGKCG